MRFNSRTSDETVLQNVYLNFIVQKFCAVWDYETKIMIVFLIVNMKLSNWKFIEELRVYVNVDVCMCSTEHCVEYNDLTARSWAYFH